MAILRRIYANGRIDDTDAMTIAQAYATARTLRVYGYNVQVIEL